MTDFEIVSLFNDLLNTSFARLQDFMAGLFAMLVTAWLAANQLSRRMAILVVTLYSIFAVVTIVPALATILRFALAGDLVREAAGQPGSVLGSLFPVLPSAALIMPIMTILLVGAYAGGLLFFFQARGRPLDD
jgi:hypothetical protein